MHQLAVSSHHGRQVHSGSAYRPSLVSAFNCLASRLLESEVLRMADISGIVVEGPTVDYVACVLLHELHGWVLAGLVIPAAGVDEGFLGGKVGHCGGRLSAELWSIGA